ncbi:transcriptional regulator [Actinomycetospora corticicola]|uniref:DNA-binding MarR family transcriptional regulator n=1 Tax=Actinomycetospora corticicola TaxID=663602 RepID=A0A7Y9DS35_9PSEU|nr:transcriptional regulator [Actinomycetospora corticicola]NYD34497.1 DNA-binding MarR family transcriptional regulator [Actinomycetospora corticicola]
MTVARFDDLIHPATRLSLVATLAAVDWAEFAYLKEGLGLSDSALSKQLTTLEDAGYVITERRLDGSRHKLRARLSDAGRDAFEGHVAALQEIVDGAGSSLQVAQSRRDDTSI